MQVIETGKTDNAYVQDPQNLCLGQWWLGKVMVH